MPSGLQIAREGRVRDEPVQALRNRQVEAPSSQRHVVTPVDLACVEDELLVHQPQELGEGRDGGGDEVALDARDSSLGGACADGELLLGEAVAAAGRSEELARCHFTQDIRSDISYRHESTFALEVQDARPRDATTTVEAIQEFVHVRARRRDRADAAALGRAYVTLLSPLLRPGEEDLGGGLRLFERQEALGTFDAVLAASAIAARAEALVSADRSFDGVRGLRWVDLSGDEVAALLAG